MPCMELYSIIFHPKIRAVNLMSFYNDKYKFTVFQIIGILATSGCLFIKTFGVRIIQSELIYGGEFYFGMHKRIIPFDNYGMYAAIFNPKIIKNRAPMMQKKVVDWILK